MRPPSIIRVERLLIFSILIRPVNLGLIGKHLLNVEALATLLPSRSVSIVPVVLGTLVSLVLCLLVSRYRSRIAAWLVGLWTVAAVGSFLVLWPNEGLFWNLALALSSIMMIAMISALLELVRPESRRWLSRQSEIDDLKQDFS